MTKYTPEEGLLFIKVISPTEKEKSSYHKGKIKISGTSQNSAREFNKAIIKHTYDENKYPVDSVWMMGEAPPMEVNFFGEHIEIIQVKNLYARIE